MLHPKSHEAVIPSPQAHWMKLAFEKYFLSRYKNGKLSVTKTSNADLPMKHGATALLTCDVWEHAYYPTHKNLRQKYVEVFLDHLAAALSTKTA